MASSPDMGYDSTWNWKFLQHQNHVCWKLIYVAIAQQSTPWQKIKMTNLDIISQIRIMKNREVKWLGPSHTGNHKDVRVCNQPYPTLSTPQTAAHQAPLSMGFPARILKLFAYSSSKGSSQPRFWTGVSCICCTGRQILYHCTTQKGPQGTGYFVTAWGKLHARWLGVGEEAWCF